MSISAFSPSIRFLFSSITSEATLKSRSLSTLVQGAHRYLRAARARAGKRAWLHFQYSNGLWFLGIVGSARYEMTYEVTEYQNITYGYIYIYFLLYALGINRALTFFSRNQMIY